MNNKLNKLITSVVFGGLVSLGTVASADDHNNGDYFADYEPGSDQSMSVNSETVLGAIRALGMDATIHEDVDGEPHFVFSDTIATASQAAIFMDDCGAAGCEDVTLYASFPASEGMTDSVFNEWNHITSRLRSKAAYSDNGEITLSLPISFYSDQDQRKLSMLIGLFVTEANFMSATINKNS